MIYTNQTKMALRIAYNAHKEQLDKSGLPYIFHPYHIAEQMETEEEVVVALLHDVVEDTNITFDDLTKEGISKSTIEALRILTHEDDEPYMGYIQRIKNSGNETAITVKLADLRHNADVTRLDTVDDKAVTRISKYKAAVDILGI